MKRTTVMADDHLLLEAKQLASHEGRPLTALFQDALREYIEAHRRPRRLSWIGMARSDRSLTAEEMDEMLIAGLDPIEGWSPSRGAQGETSRGEGSPGPE
jgi:hypothetical protein